MNGVERGNAARGRVEARRSTRWSQAFPEARETWDAAWAGRIGEWTLPEFEAGEELATRAAGKTVMQAFKRRGADDDRRRRRPRRVDVHRVRGRRPLLRQLGRPQHPVRHPRARDGLDRQRDRRARRLRQAVRVDVPDLQRLHAAGGAAVGADGAARRLGLDARLGRPRRGRADAPAGRDVRGAARDPEPLVRPARPTRTRRRTRGRSRSSGPTARSRSSLSRQKVPTLDRTELAPASGLERGRVHALGVDRLARPDPDRRPAPRSGSRSRPAAGSPTTGPPSASSRCRAGSSSTQQPQEYRDEVLPPDVKARLSIEAGRRARLERVGRRRAATRSRSSTSARRRPGATVLESSVTTSTTSSPARGPAGACRVMRVRADQGVPRARRPRASPSTGSCRPSSSRGSRSGSTATRSRASRPTAVCFRSASRSTRARSPGSRSCEARRRVRPPRRAPARRGARVAGRARGDRLRHRHRRGADRLPGQGARGRRGDPARPGRARGARLRLRRRRLRRRLQDDRDPRVDLPRHLQRPSGRRARRHECSLPRLGGRRARRSRASWSRRSSVRPSTAATATSSACRRSRSWKGR